VYGILRDFKKEKENYEKALKIYKDLGNEIEITNTQVNIANILIREKQFEKALDYVGQAHLLNKKINYREGLCNTYGSFGRIYYTMHNYPKALDNLIWSLELSEEIQDKSITVNRLMEIALVHMARRNYANALTHTEKAFEISTALGEQSKIVKVEKMLSEIYEAKGDNRAALEHYKRFIIIRDSVYNEENTKNVVRSEMNFEFEKKEAATKLEQEKKEAVAAAESKKQKVIIWGVCGILLLVFAFAVIAYRSYLQKQKANIEITKQKEVIEEKQKEILDSIYYARRIQRALIPSDRNIQKHLKKLQG